MILEGADDGVEPGESAFEILNEDEDVDAVSGQGLGVLAEMREGGFDLEAGEVQSGDVVREDLVDLGERGRRWRLCGRLRLVGRGRAWRPMT